MWRTCFLLCVAYGAALPLIAQPCGLNDTLSIAQNTSAEFTYEVFDIFNDDLSASDQGVCGVQIRFAHQYVDNLVITLTSPAGQSVTLIGPNTDQQFEFTFGAVWDVAFVPCLETPDPDPGSLFSWDNNQTGNFSNLNFYDGSYYPYQGCLEDFNTGPANGAWTISVDNAPSEYLGEVTRFFIEFCDARGPDCCFAQAGNLEGPDLLTCEGDTALALDIPPLFPSDAAPDTAIYGYTYLIAESGILTGYDTLPDFTGAPPGHYQVCGLSYQLAEADSLHQPDGLLTVDSVRNNLTGLEPKYCGELTDSCIEVTILPLPMTEVRADTICEGDSLMVGDSVLTNSGFYEIELPSYAGCDSLVELTLTVVPPVDTQLAVTLCAGDSIEVGTQTYQNTGSYQDTLIAVSGCDSIVNLDLTVLPPIVTDTTVAICAGEFYTVGDSTFTVSGQYTVILNSAASCDSIVNLNLEVLAPAASIAPAFDLTCVTTEIIMDGTLSSPSSSLSYQWYAPDGTPLGTLPTQATTVPGAHVLEASLSGAGGITCLSFDTLLINIDTIPPVAEAATPDTLNCTVGEALLDGSATTPIAGTAFFWFTDDGNITGDPFLPTTTADAPGIYYLAAMDMDNRCGDTIAVTVVEDQSVPVVDPGPDTTLSCAQPTLTLDGSGSSTGPQYQYLWTAEDGLVPPGGNTLTPLISQGGVYQLRVENTQTNCLDSAEVAIGYDTIAPRLTIAPPDTLTCTQPAVSLQATAVAAGDSPAYSWSANPGNIVGDNTGLDISVDLGGLYTLVGENTGNGCRDTAAVEVIANTAVVEAAIAPTDTLSCSQSTVTLDGSASSTGGTIVYSWSGDPAPPAATDTLITTTNLPGDYQLIVRDTLSHCADTATVSVALDTLHPVSNAGPDRLLTCDSTTVTLSGFSSSTGSNLDYDWVEVFGTGLVDTNTLQTTVTSPGVYMLVVTNTQNGCFDTSFAIVNIDTLSPAAAIAPPLRLTCDRRDITLDGTASSSGPGFSFSWSASSGGNFSGGTNSLLPDVNAPGLYSLTIENDSTGCTQTATATVVQDTLLPVAQAGQDSFINCANPVIEIGSPATSQGPDLVHTWTGPSGGIIGPANTPFIQISSPGTYQLLVRNTTTGCEAADEVLIIDDRQLPVAEAGPNAELDCAAPQATLSGAGSTLANTVLSWSGPCIEGDTASLEAEIFCEGAYTLAVRDTTNGCTSVDTVTVTLDPLSPIAVLPDTLLLSCEAGTADMDASASEGDAFFWLFNGTPYSETGLEFTVDSIGSYTLIAANESGTCTDTATVMATLDCTPSLQVATPDTLTCAVTSITLDASGTTMGSNITYQWTGPGAACIIDDANTLQPSVRCPGDYQLVATNTTFSLSDTAMVTVIADTLPPVAEAGPGDTLTCPEPTTLLSAEGSSTGPGIGYTWTKLDDETFVKDSFSILVNDASTYFLTVLDSTNGCLAEDIAVVQRSDNLPDLNFSSTIIPCMQDTFWLQSFVQPQGPDYLYNWEGDIVLAGADSLAVLLDTAGTVRLTVVNPANDCSSYRDVTLTQQECVPCLDDIPADTLTCSRTDLTLAGSFCEPCIGCTVTWSTANGSLASNPDSLSVLVDAPGLYTLTATDTLGFSATAHVVVAAQTTSPELQASPDLTLNCRDTAAVLEAGPAAGPILLYEWASPGGPLTVPDTLPTLHVNSPGTYIVTGTDPQTGCAATDTVQVTADTLPPVAEAGQGRTLTCSSPSVSLNGSGSDFGNSIIYEWSGPTAANIAGSNTFNPTVNQPGLYLLAVTDTLSGCIGTDSVFVQLNDSIPPVPPLADTALTCAAPTVNIQGSLPAAEGYSFCWYRLNASGEPAGPCVSTLSIDVSLTGTYQFLVENDSNGCTNTAEVTVSLDTISPMLDPMPDSLLFPCNADSLLLTASASPTPVSYQWLSPEGAPILNASSSSATVFQPGLYQLEVERPNNGCTASRQIVVAEDNRTPLISMGPDTSLNCSRQQVRLIASVATAEGEADLLWGTMTGEIISGGSTNQPMVGAPGWYYLTATDVESGCSRTDSVLVSNARFFPTAAIADSTSLLLNCDRDSLLLDGTVSTGGTGAGLAYEWRRGAFNAIGQTSTQWIAQTGNYQMMIEDLGSGCRDTLPFTVDGDFTPPAVMLNDPAPLSCNRLSATLSGAGSSEGPAFLYTWLAPDSTVLATEAPAIEVSTPGIYTLRIENTENGCTAEATQTLESNADFPEVAIQVPGELNCSQPEVQLDGSASASTGPLAFEWSAGSGSALAGPTDQPTATATLAGWYFLDVTNLDNGCVRTDSIEVTASAPLIEEAVWLGTSPACPGDKNGFISLDTVTGGTPPFLAGINGGALASTSIFSNLAAGAYDVALEDANGCTWETMVSVPAASGINVELGADTTIQLGQALTLVAQTTPGAADAIRWWPTEGSVQGQSLTVAPQLTTVYQVWATDANGCTATDQVTVRVLKRAPVYAPTVFSPNGDQQNDVFLLYAGEAVRQVEIFRVFDRWGNLVHEAAEFLPNDPVHGWDGTFRGSEMDSGVFVFYAEARLADGSLAKVSGDVLLLR